MKIAEFKTDHHRRFCSAGRYVFRAAVYFIFLTGICGLAGAQRPSETETPKMNGNYRIGVGDVLRVLVVKQNLLSVDGVRVGNDGTIRLPMLDAEITAACLTEAELSAAITARYKKYLLNPQVYVAVREFNANPVALVGAVIAPGRFQLQRPTRLLELMTYVNGPAPNAGKTVQIIRSQNSFQCAQNVTANPEKSTAQSDEQEIIALPLAEVLKGNESVNPFLQAGDIVRVSEAELEQAFVIGNVKAAVTINLREPVTLSKAIAMAGGIAPGANTEKIKISRQSPNSLGKTEVIVNLKDIDKRKQDDILLQPNDIVDVPGASGARKFLRDIFRTVVPVVTRVPVVIP
jgi:polysaccharide biosynthesis/export protein